MTLAERVAEAYSISRPPGSKVWREEPGAQQERYIAVVRTALRELMADARNAHEDWWRELLGLPPINAPHN